MDGGFFSVFFPEEWVVLRKSQSYVSTFVFLFVFCAVLYNLLPWLGENEAFLEISG